MQLVVLLPCSYATFGPFLQLRKELESLANQGAPRSQPQPQPQPQSADAKQKEEKKGEGKDAKDSKEKEEKTKEVKESKPADSSSSTASAVAEQNDSLDASPDEAAYQLLVLVYRQRTAAAAKRFLSQRDSLGTLLSLLGNSTLRLQRLALRLLRFMLTDAEVATRLHPAYADGKGGK